MPRLGRAVEPGLFQHAAVVEHQAGIVVEGQAVDRVVPAAERVQHQRKEIVHVERRIDQFGEARHDVFDRHDPFILGEVADPHEVDQRDVQIAAGHEVADLFAECVLVGVGDDVDVDARFFGKGGQHFLDGVITRAQQEHDIDGRAGIGRGGLGQTPGAGLGSGGGAVAATSAVVQSMDFRFIGILPSRDSVEIICLDYNTNV